MASDVNTVLLTGLPRSGTTLACALLNDLPNTVALAEPMRIDAAAGREAAVRQIDEFVVQMRRQALQSGSALSMHIDGMVPDNWVADPRPGAELRAAIGLVHGDIAIAKALTPEFRLVVKHPGEFTALADMLSTSHQLYAIVRNPLAVLASWQTVAMPVQKGRLPAAEALNQRLAALLDAETDVLKRQVALIGWILETYAVHLPDRVLRYEDMVADPMPALALLTPFGGGIDRCLSAVLPASRYPGVDLHRLLNGLAQIRSVIEVFYPEFLAGARELI